MRAASFPGGGRKAAFWSVLLLAAALSAAAGPAAQGSGVPWSALTLQATQLGSTATTEVTLDLRPAASETPQFIESRRGQPLQASGAAVQKLSVATTLDIFGSRSVRFENQLWLDPLTRTPLYLIRTRFGLKDYHQRFRFTREGVFRQQREPASARETAEPPESWSKLGEHFYPYPPERPAGSPVIETSMLITLVGAFAAEPPDTIAALGVFHKRQVHRVSVQALPAQRVRFDYLEKRAGQETRRAGTVWAPGVAIASRPIGSYRGDVEDFIRDGSQLFLSPGDFLPLVVSGELPLIGRVEMELKEVHLK